MKVTWNEIFAEIPVLAESLHELVSASGRKLPSKQKVLSEIYKSIKDVTGMSEREVELFDAALMDNLRWFNDAERGAALGNACRNKKIFKIMQDLFVVDPAIDISFLTTEPYITGSSGYNGGDRGLNWKRTPFVTRRRRNRVMNWGTLHTSFAPSDHDPGTRVLLVPDTDISDSLVYVSGPLLTRYANRFRHLLEKHRFGENTGIDELPFFYAMFRMSGIAIDYEEEREALTYSDEVRCSVHRIDDANFRGVDYKQSHARRLMVAREEQPDGSSLYSLRVR
jgi:hypothetical protein